jgi:GH15 family glucan-1,4-alpha-glucosidase
LAIDLRRHSIEVIRSGQAVNGAYIASPTFKTYYYSWLRDGAFIAYGMDRAGQHDSALAFHRWVHETVCDQGHKVDQLVAKSAAGEAITDSEWLHCRFTLDGREGDEDWNNFQLDGYGAWLWALVEHVKATGRTDLIQEFGATIDLVLKYLITFWDRPCYDSWEEFGDRIHPSTLACLYGGMKAIAPYRGNPGLEAACAEIKAYVLKQFVHGGRLTKFADGRSVDTNLLWVTVPFGMLEPTDPIMVATVAEIERRCNTGGLHRYPEDTYYGGGEWLLLTAWLGWYYNQIGNPAPAHGLLAWIEAQADESGDMPEQVNTRVNDPSMIQEWIDRWGTVAKPLLWSHAMYLVLVAEVGAKRQEWVR